MACPRCGGCLVTVHEVGLIEEKCLNCGHRQTPRADVEEPMPKFKSEEARQRWLEGVRKRRAAKAQPEAAAGGTTAAGGGDALTTAIEAIEAKLAELQAIRQSLLRAREVMRG